MLEDVPTTFNEMIHLLSSLYRFPMILPEHLAEFEDSNFQKENHELFAPYLLSAYRYHALAVRGRRDVRGACIFLICVDGVLI